MEIITYRWRYALTLSDIAKFPLTVDIADRTC